ncbi:hypothetical protein QBC39DRAFT_398551 [Podospora conica]|nr:hypothetical protein QBC39DRAFT_398551 [Schizothecium conicum]
MQFSARLRSRERRPHPGANVGGRCRRGYAPQQTARYDIIDASSVVVQGRQGWELEVLQHGSIPANVTSLASSAVAGCDAAGQDTAPFLAKKTIQFEPMYRGLSEGQQYAVRDGALVGDGLTEAGAWGSLLIRSMVKIQRRQTTSRISDAGNRGKPPAVHSRVLKLSWPKKQMIITRVTEAAKGSHGCTTHPTFWVEWEPARLVEVRVEDVRIASCECGRGKFHREP